MRRLARLPWRPRQALFIVTLLLACGPGRTQTLKSPFHLRGTTVNALDGTPIPFSRLTVTLSPVPGGAALERPARPPGARGRRIFPNVERHREGDESVTADASGHFDISLPHPGSWALRGVARDFRSQAFEEHDGFYAGVVLTESAPSLDVRFRMYPNATIQGKIYDEAGEPVQAAQVQAEPVAQTQLNSTEQPIATALTDDRGLYELAGLAAGSYRIRVQGRPWYAHGDPGRGQVDRSPGADSPSALDPSLDVVYPITWFPGTTDSGGAGVVCLRAGEDREVSLQLAPIPAAHLRIPAVDLGVKHVGGADSPAFLSLLSEGSFTTTTARRGSEWEFGSLAPGSYELRLPPSPGSSGPETRQIQIRAGGPATVGLEGSIPFTKVTVSLEGVAPQARPQVAFVEWKPGQTELAGHAGRRTLASVSSRFSLEAPSTDGRGKLSAMLLPGMYQIMVSGADSTYLASITATGAQADGRIVTIPEGSEAKLELHLATGRATVNGIATLQGEPLAGVMVLLVPAGLGRPDNLAFIERDETNTDGSFSLAAVIPGKYILLAIEDGWTLHWNDPQTIAPYLLHGVPLEVTPSANLRQTILVQPR